MCSGRSHSHRRLRPLRGQKRLDSVFARARIRLVDRGINAEARAPPLGARPRLIRDVLLQRCVNNGGSHLPNV